MAKTRTIYRDTKTGHFCKKSSWQQAKRRGSKRFKRERVKIGKRPPPPPPPPPPPEEVHEYVVSFSYDKTGRMFDVIVTATSEHEANEVAKQFLRDDQRGQRISRSKFAGWSNITARGARSNEEAGEAEYRSDSEEE